MSGGQRAAPANDFSEPFKLAQLISAYLLPQVMGSACCKNRFVDKNSYETHDFAFLNVASWEEEDYVPSAAVYEEYVSKELLANRKRKGIGTPCAH